ncbi:GGDEF domain-containing protein [Actinoplanes sp. NPDC051475]|uniref:GGDEF domain-containing protein n=1 Tax=Actinoplanes sp. NPDC051475 TaxID=3157225 RepID=UPI00344C361C
MDITALDAAALSDALTELEDGYVFDTSVMRTRAEELERRAYELGDELLAARARLCSGHLWLRSGDLSQTTRIFTVVTRWATAHGARQLLSRAHSLWATLYRHLGDAAAALDHMLISVELLDESATAYMQVWHRTKLADALGQVGSIGSARERYAQAAQLAAGLGQTRLHVGTLNNWAWTESAFGDPEEAARIAAEMLRAAAAYGHELEPADMDTVASVHVASGRYEEAERMMLECIDRHRRGEHEEADALAEYLLTLARARRGRGAADEAQRSLDDCRALCTDRELHALLARVHQEQAELHASRGRFPEALLSHKAFFALHSRLHSQQREAQARTRQAMFETAEARREAERFREQARRDALTGLRNRRFIDERLPGLIADSPALTLALLDVDNFKRLNDELSHEAGDRVLARLARILEAELEACAPDGFAARLGGEEFLLVLPGLAPRDALATLDALRLRIRDHAWSDVTGVRAVTVSVGVAGLPDDDERAAPALLARADARLYAAKRGGRDRVMLTP